MKRIINTLALFSSMGTLVCCALPALFVTIGAGAAFAGIVSNVPQLIWLSEHKIPLFIFAAVMLSFSAFMQYRNRYAPCPIDKDVAEACARLRKTSFYIFVFSLCIFLIGFFFAFIAPRMF